MHAAVVEDVDDGHGADGADDDDGTDVVDDKPVCASFSWCRVKFSDAI